jgi:hypothetical protein
MGKKDPRIDAYIARSPEFARPILTHLRALVHKGCPDVVETMKWSVPHFEHHGSICGMAAFKAHCIFGFWKASLLAGGPDAVPMMRHRIETAADVPADRTILRLVRQAAKLNEQGVTVPSTRSQPKPPVEAPSYFLNALRTNKRAWKTYEDFSPSHKREYIEWIVEAKGDDTRQRRVQAAIAQMAEGKPRNWKYMRK